MEILKKLAEKFADGLVLLKEAKVEEAIAKLAEAAQDMVDAETAIKEVEDKTTALETENADLKEKLEEVEVEKKAKQPKKPENWDTMTPEEQQTWMDKNSDKVTKLSDEGVAIIEKFVSMNLNADTMETLINDLKTVSEMLNSWGDMPATVAAVAEEVAKIKKLKSVSQQLDDEAEPVKKTGDKWASISIPK